MTEYERNKIEDLFGLSIVDIHSRDDSFIIILSNGRAVSFHGESTSVSQGRSILSLPCGLDVLADD